MIPVQPQHRGVPATPIRRRGSVEIYFVLYLSAIILILGTTPPSNSSREEVLEAAIRHLLTPNFRVRADQASLVYSFVPPGVRISSNGILLERDSINRIFAEGEFSSVDFEIASIVDSASGESLPLDRATLDRQGKREAIFHWTPGSDIRNAVYSVTVVGHARPLPPSGISDDRVRRQILDIIERGGTVADSATFTVSVIAIESRVAGRIPGRDTTGGGIDTVAANNALFVDTLRTGSGGGGFTLTSNDVTAIQGDTWRNRINVNGASANTLQISTTPSGIAVVTATNDYVELRGATPRSGTDTVTVTMRRTSDNAATQTRFVVRSARIAPPRLPQTLYQGETYLLDFGVEGMADVRVGVQVVENDRVVISRANGGATLRYAPSASGTVRFERFIDNKSVDKYVANLRELPAPTLEQPVADGSDAIVTTYAFGSEVRGRRNVPRLVVEEGENATEPQPIGEPRFEEITKRWVQRWRISRRNENRPLIFRAYVLDQRGSDLKSRIISYSD